MTAETLLDVEPTLLLRCMVRGDPQPQGSKSIVGRCPHHQLVESNRATLRPWRAEMTAAFRTQRLSSAPYDEAVSVRAVFAFPIALSAPKSWAGRAKFRWASRAADLDKLTRALLDSLQAAGVISNDARVVELRVSKMHAGHGETFMQRPGVAVEVTAL